MPEFPGIRIRVSIRDTRISRIRVSGKVCKIAILEFYIMKIAMNTPIPEFPKVGIGKNVYVNRNIYPIHDSHKVANLEKCV